ncbi:unnamed protein product, partial [Closterium sp. NIES-54]
SSRGVRRKAAGVWQRVHEGYRDRRQDDPCMQLGDVVTSAVGLAFEFHVHEMEGPFAVDYYLLTIDGLVALDLRLRIAHPKLQTPSDVEVHLNVGIAELEHTNDIHGVLGQTYRNNHSQRAADFQRVIATLQHPISADGPEGEGFLDGTPRSYEASSVLAVDCAYTAFDRAQYRVSEATSPSAHAPRFKSSSLPSSRRASPGHATPPIVAPPLVAPPLRSAHLPSARHASPPYAFCGSPPLFATPRPLSRFPFHRPLSRLLSPCLSSHSRAHIRRTSSPLAALPLPSSHLISRRRASSVECPASLQFCRDRATWEPVGYPPHFLVDSKDSRRISSEEGSKRNGSIQRRVQRRNSSSGSSGGEERVAEATQGGSRCGGCDAG